MRQNTSRLRFNDGSDAASKDLQLAVWNGNCSEVLAALDDGADPNSRGIGGHPLLLAATFQGHLRLAQMLLDHGADPGASPLRPSALEAAIRSGHTRIAYALLKSGVVPQWQDAHLAALCGRTRLLRRFLKTGVEVNRLGGVGGTVAVTLAMAAAFAGETSTIQTLVECGADVDLGNENGWTALHSATSCGHTEVVKLLLSFGASANATDRGGDTPLTMAVKEGHDEVVAILQGAGAGH